MSTLLDSLAAAFDGDSARRSVLDDAIAAGLPSQRDEAWKYTSLRALERRSFAAVDATPELDAALVAHIPAPRLVFANGRHLETLSDLSGLDDGVSVQRLSQALADGGDAARFLARRFERGDEVFARLNAALASEGVLLRVEADVQSTTPLHLVFVGTADTTDRAWHLRNLIELRAGAKLRVVEHHLAAGEHAHLSNALTHVHLSQGAQLVHARAQHESDKATSLLRTDAVLARDAVYTRLDLELGAALSRHELNVRLEGENARLDANGVLLAGGRRHVDTRLGIDHIARDTSCGLTWRGLGTGRGRAVFHGGILIREGADGTDARLSNKNLLLSDNAEIDTQPVLEIHADEVQAAHGATVGRLDANALFYLRSRGLPQEQATRLLTAAFCREPLSVLGDDALVAQLADAVDAALRQAGAA
ncbi:Iron-regulated ABC transporter permease protein SufD [Pseudoxanthomonas sp. GM95]|uniref:Fe-S cluster assembly protein SufD n=1 Tax=Pseudoxanthomonas sp. GM95 TaxID=1881043 RepID=UPI0008D091DE|nr:Fe-S cluster assembly protein SufD [Pseudoxanthomonas sp. GM95]SEL77093.1 Iron-regulated ABC transporter permease protein SufD [Pseudoxanthomonas sp. GM95]